MPLPSTPETIKEKGAELVSAIPVIGQFARIFWELIPETYDRRQRDFMRDLEDRVTTLEVDYDALKRPHYQSLVVRTQLLLLQDYQHEKLEAYKNILLNAAVAPIDPTLEELFTLLTGRLTALSISLLREMSSPEPLTARTGFGYKVQVSPEQVWRRLRPNLDLSVLRASLDLLGRERLTSVDLGRLDRKSALNEDMLRLAITPFGWEYVAFVLSAPAGAGPAQP